MTNAEKYREEIENYKGGSFCDDFVLPTILKEEKCTRRSCNQCRMAQMIWLMDEYKAPETDWSKVAVDTPILVRDEGDTEWKKGYFAKYSDGYVGYVFAWKDGRTSWTSYGVSRRWDFAKLAEEGGAE